MSGADSELLEQQRQRRKRINRMKTTIVMSIAIWMLVSFLAIIILAVQVVRLNSRVNKLELQQKNVGYMVDSEASEQLADSDDINTESDPTYSNVITGIDSDDNMAASGDLHKVYLTFDCVPGDNTIKLLDELKECGVKATFFVSGDASEESQDIYKRIVEEGHTIGMHSYSNQYSSIYGSAEDFEADLTKISDHIKLLTDLDCSFYRFPGGSGNQISNVPMPELVKILNSKNIKYFDWNVSSGDNANDCTSEDIVNNVMGGISKYKNSVVLLHDDKDKTFTLEAIRPLVEALRNEGAEILPIDDNTYVVQYIKADSVE